MPDADASPASPEKRAEEEQEEEEEAPGKAAKRAAPAAEEEQPTPRKTRLPRACNNKPKPAPPPPPPERTRRRAAAAAAGGADETPQCRVVTPLVSEPEAPAELPRWQLRCMWELGAVLNFLHVRALCPPSHSRAPALDGCRPLELRGV